MAFLGGKDFKLNMNFKFNMNIGFHDIALQLRITTHTFLYCLDVRVQPLLPSDSLSNVYPYCPQTPCLPQTPRLALTPTPM